MRTLLSGAAALTAAIALTLLSAAASTANAAEVTDRGAICMRDVPALPTLPPNGLLLDQMEGKYQLSNGQRVTLHRVHQRLWIDFGRRRDIPLDHVGQTRFTSRDGSVDLSFRPDSEQISMRYPADARGRFVRAC